MIRLEEEIINKASGNISTKMLDQMLAVSDAELVKTIMNPMVDVFKTFTGNNLVSQVLQHVLGMGPVKGTMNTLFAGVISAFDSIDSTLGKPPIGIHVESMLIPLIKIPEVRESLMIVMTRLRPLMGAVEPEIMGVMNEMIRLEGMKEGLWPLIMSIGPIYDQLVVPKVVMALGDLTKYPMDGSMKFAEIKGGD